MKTISLNTPKRSKPILLIAILASVIAFSYIILYRPFNSKPHIVLYWIPEARAIDTLKLKHELEQAFKQERLSDGIDFFFDPTNTPSGIQLKSEFFGATVSDDKISNAVRLITSLSKQSKEAHEKLHSEVKIANQASLKSFQSLRNSDGRLTALSETKKLDWKEARVFPYRPNAKSIEKIGKIKRRLECILHIPMNSTAMIKLAKDSLATSGESENTIEHFPGYPFPVSNQSPVYSMFFEDSSINNIPERDRAPSLTEQAIVIVFGKFAREVDVAESDWIYALEVECENLAKTRFPVYARRFHYIEQEKSELAKLLEAKADY